MASSWPLSPGVSSSPSDPAFLLMSSLTSSSSGVDNISDATLNSFGLHYEGKDRFVVRKEIAVELESKGHLIKTEQYIHKVGTSERTKEVIEPRLSDQWFLKMETLAKPAIKAVLEDQTINLFPKKFENTYRHWMENIRDWNISRQLFWGQQSKGRDVYYPRYI